MTTTTISTITASSSTPTDKLNNNNINSNQQTEWLSKFVKDLSPSSLIHGDHHNIPYTTTSSSSSISSTSSFRDKSSVISFVPYKTTNSLHLEEVKTISSNENNGDEEKNINNDNKCVHNHIFQSQSYLQPTSQTSNYIRCPVCCRSISSTNGSSYNSIGDSIINTGDGGDSLSSSLRKQSLSFFRCVSESFDFQEHKMTRTIDTTSTNKSGDWNGHSGRHRIQINRDPINLSTLEQIHNPVKQPYRSSRRIIYRLLPIKISFLNTIFAVFPILKWLPAYDFKEDLLSDIIAGVTVLAMQIPQGLAYSKLAGVDPVYGLYGTFFSMVIYSFMGTSRQMSMGKLDVHLYIFFVCIT